MRLRDYRPEDFNELWRLDQECFPPNIAYSRFELMTYIRRRSAFTIVAEDDAHAIAGFLVTERNVRQNAGHIITLDVRTSARRAGVGTILMDAAESRLQQVGCTAVYLETAVNNDAAIAFYKRRGYFVLSTIPRYYDGKVDALVMGKKLPSTSAQK